MIGGEHTITLGAIRSLTPEAVIVFDAHLDLRDVLYGQRLCHATYLRRAHEEKKFKLIIIGARALSNEEIDYTEKNNINVITSRDIKTFGTGPIINMLKDELDKIESIYLSIDMDVIGPSEAPAVGNPCPEGISVTDLLDILGETIDNRFIGFDLNEVSPTYDSGITSIQAAYVILETLYIKSEKHNIDE